MGHVGTAPRTDGDTRCTVPKVQGKNFWGKCPWHTRGSLHNTSMAGQEPAWWELLCCAENVPRAHPENRAAPNLGDWQFCAGNEGELLPSTSHQWGMVSCSSSILTFLPTSETGHHEERHGHLPHDKPSREETGCSLKPAAGYPKQPPSTLEQQQRCPSAFGGQLGRYSAQSTLHLAQLSHSLKKMGGEQKSMP